jgi:hypothetical protein
MSKYYIIIYLNYGYKQYNYHALSLCSHDYAILLFLISIKLITIKIIKLKIKNMSHGVELFRSRITSTMASSN